MVTAVRRGETAVLARYEGNYAAATLIVMGDRSAFAWQPTPDFNWVDKLVYDKLKRLKIQPSDVCSDSDFIRRVYLDLTGLPPEPEDRQEIPATTGPSKVKREKLIDKLVGSPEFVEQWTNKWADLLAGQSQVPRRRRARTRFASGFATRRRRTCPTISSCYKLLTGDRLQPRASRGVLLQDPARSGRGHGNTTHLFLATRFNCNKCHDHPFERWTQNQYYETVVVLRPDQPQGGSRSSRANGRSKARPCEAAAAAGRDHRGHQDGRDQKPAHGRGWPSRRFPFQIAAHASADRQPARTAGQVDHLQGEPVLRQELRQSHVELPAGRRHHRTGGRHPGRQPAEQSAAARQAIAGVHRRAASTCAN